MKIALAVLLFVLPAFAAEKTTLPSGDPINRAALLQVLSGSPGAFLSHVDSEPEFRDGHFYGWRLRALYPDDARFSNASLHPGDVILRINQRRVEHPEEFLQVWKTLKRSKELRVELERNGKIQLLRWPIID